MSMRSPREHSIQKHCGNCFYYWATTMYEGECRESGVEIQIVKEEDGRSYAKRGWRIVKYSGLCDKWKLNTKR